MFVHEQSQPPWVPSPRRLELCSYKDNEAEVRVPLLARAEEDSLAPFVHEQSQPPWVPSPRRLELCSYKDNDAEVRVPLLARAEEDSLAPFGVGRKRTGT